MLQLLEDPKPTIVFTPDYYKVLTTDPRPDLFDTELWTKLLKRIALSGTMDLNNFQALNYLHSVRAVGTVLRWNHHTNYMLEPLFDFGNWESMEQFQEMKKTYLTPYLSTFKNWINLINHD